MRTRSDFSLHSNVSKLCVCKGGGVFNVSHACTKALTVKEYSHYNVFLYDETIAVSVLSVPGHSVFKSKNMSTSI